MIIEKHIKITDAELFAVQLLKNEVSLSSSQIKLAIQKGCLWLEKGQQVKRLRRLKTPLKIDQQLHFYYNASILEQKPLTAKLIEDNDAYSIWYKPAGMLSQGSRWGDHTTLYRYAEQHLKPERKAYIVHRLDKMTSGIIILAHQRKVAAAFTQIFEKRKIKKCYRATVHGQVKKTNSWLIDTPLNGKSAMSRVQVIQYDKPQDQTRLKVTIDTGRKHQIRQHLSEQGFPIVGDRLYGIEADKNEQAIDLQLVAYQVQFTCPISHEIKNFQLDEIFKDGQFINHPL